MITPGCSATCATPATASTPNHNPMTGPKNLPTAPVPKRWMTNNAVRIVSAIGTTSESSDGETTSSPSTADSTEIAGVIMPSP